MAESQSKHLPVIDPAAELNFKINNPTAISIVSSTSQQYSIYIGTVTGNLLLLNLNSATSSISVLKQTVISGGHQVIAIQVVTHLGRLLLLSTDGYLYTVDLLLLEPVRKVTVVKGGGGGGGVGVSAISRRFFGQNYRFPEGFNHVVRSNGVKVVEDGGGSSNSNSSSCSVFAAAVGKKLVLMEMISGGSIVILKEIQGVFDGAVGVLVWLDDSIIFGNLSGYYVYSCVEGQCRLIFSLPESSGPPRLKLLVKECKVLLVVDNVGVIVDAEGQPVAGSLVFQDEPDSVGEIGRHVVVLRKGKVELYHKKSGVCLQTVVCLGDGSWSQCVLTNEEGSNGEFLAVATNSKVVCYRKVSSEEQIKYLLRKKRFNEAISLVEELQSEGELSKEMLSFVHAQVGFLLMFDLHFEEAVNHFLLAETMQPSELFPFIMRDPNRWSLLVPRNRYWGLHPPPKPLEIVVDDGLKSLQRAIFLRKAGIDTAIDDTFLVNPPSSAGLLESAIKNMIRYLEASREKDLITPVKEGVDTLLMYLYRAFNCTEAMDKLASSENSCVVEELESLLSASGHLRTLAYLYASKGMNSKALDIWHLLARNISPSSRKDPVGNHDSPHTPSATSSHETAVVEASMILEESSDQDLVLQHLGWIAEISQALAVQVLISEKRTDMLAADDVISAIDPKKVEILERYLQWLIEDRDSDDTRFHTMYALLLAKSALEACEMENASLKLKDLTLTETVSPNCENDTIFDTPVRERLQNFLQSSDLYDPDEVLDLIEASELWLEKAILYRKLGQETLVLQILALKLEDCEAAEAYCAEIGRPDAYMQLLEMYLDPKDGRQPMFNAAVRLLHNHGESLDPIQVLEKLSSDMPLQLASDTILRMLRARLHHHRQGQIVHSMSRALDTDANLARLEERSRHVLINDESVCDSCRARLGTKLFAMYPDDTVVCYKCFRRQGESTSVTGRDFKVDVLYKPGWLVTR